MYTHIYLQIYVHAIITSEERGHEFESKQGGKWKMYYNLSKGSHMRI